MSFCIMANKSQKMFLGTFSNDCVNAQILLPKAKIMFLGHAGAGKLLLITY